MTTDTTKAALDNCMKAPLADCMEWADTVELNAKARADLFGKADVMLTHTAQHLRDYAALLRANAAVPDLTLHDGSWYWVRYQGLHRVFEAAAMYKAAPNAFYSHEFSGIRVSEIEVLRNVSAPSAPVLAEPQQPVQGGGDAPALRQFLDAADKAGITHLPDDFAERLAAAAAPSPVAQPEALLDLSGPVAVHIGVLRGIAGCLHASLPTSGVPPTGWHFHRYVAGQERAEDVLVERATSLTEAIKTAARICPPSPLTVLVHAPQPAAARVGLSNFQIDALADAAFKGCMSGRQDDFDRALARAIEAAHGIASPQEDGGTA